MKAGTCDAGASATLTVNKALLGLTLQGGATVDIDTQTLQSLECELDMEQIETWQPSYLFGHQGWIAARAGC